MTVTLDIDTTRAFFYGMGIGALIGFFMATVAVKTFITHVVKELEKHL